MKETLSALGDILFMERGVAPEKTRRATYKVMIEFANKPRDVKHRKLFLRRVIEESLATT